MSIKRTLALILALAMIFSLGVPTYAFAEEGEIEESVEALAPVEVIDEIEEAEAISLEPVAETEGKIVLEDAAAEIEIVGAGVTEKFATLGEAIAAAGGASEVQADQMLDTKVVLLKNVEENLTIAKDVTIDGKGKTLNGSITINSGNVTLTELTIDTIGVCIQVNGGTLSIPRE